MTKSFVTLEREKCPVCLSEHDTGTLLLDKRLREQFEHHTLTGWGLCEICEAKHADGYVAMIACDEDKSQKEPNGTIKLEGAYRTGAIAHVRRTVAAQIFNCAESLDKPFVFCDQGVIEYLQKIPVEDGPSE